MTTEQQQALLEATDIYSKWLESWGKDNSHLPKIEGETKFKKENNDFVLSMFSNDPYSLELFLI